MPLQPRMAENQRIDNRIFPSRGRAPGPVSSQRRAELCVRCEHRLCCSGQSSICRRIPALAAVNASSSRSCKLPGSYMRMAGARNLAHGSCRETRGQQRHPCPAGTSLANLSELLAPVFKRPLQPHQHLALTLGTPLDAKKNRGSAKMLCLRHLAASCQRSTLCR